MTIRPFPNVIYKQNNPVYQYGNDPGKRLLIIGLTEKPDTVEDIPIQTTETYSTEELVKRFLEDDYNLNQLYYYQPYSINSLKQAESIFGASSNVYKMVNQIYDAIGPVRVYGMNIYLDNLNLDDEYNDITRLIDTLEHVEFDYILMDANVRLETHYELFDEFTDLAYMKENQGKLVHMISMTKVNDSERAALFKKIGSFQKIYRGNTNETGKYLTIVKDQVIEIEAHTYYASFLLQQLDQESPVNKKLLEKITLKNEVATIDEKDYYENGVVLLKDSFHRGVVFASATTAVLGSTSVHKSFPNFKIASAFIRYLYYKFDYFIGKPMHFFMNQHLMNIMYQAEKAFVELGAIREIDYEFTIDELAGIVFLKIYIIPIFTVDEIIVSTRIEVNAS